MEETVETIGANTAVRVWAILGSLAIALGTFSLGLLIPRSMREREVYPHPSIAVKPFVPPPVIPRVVQTPTPPAVSAPAHELFVGPQVKFELKVLPPANAAKTGDRTKRPE